jgi:hypothetical protein
MSLIKRLTFLLLCLVSCGIVYLLVSMSWMMTIFLLDGDTSVLRWAAVVAISTMVLFLLWRNINRIHKTLWNVQKRKEKPKIEKIKRLESDETEIAYSNLPAEQSVGKSSTNS